MSANLSQTQLNKILAATYQALPEHRRGQNCVYRLADAAWAAFVVFFSQARSFLARRRDARRATGQANTARLFGGGPTPTDPQIRNLLDPLLPRHFFSPFHTIFQRLKTGGYLELV